MSLANRYSVDNSMRTLSRDLFEQDAKEGKFQYGKYEVKITDTSKRNIETYPLTKYEKRKSQNKCVTCGKKALKNPKGGYFITCKKCKKADLKYQKKRRDSKK